ncbi:hypothetical protein GCM10022381_21840 [Leifsonia kafniensis]|uniref:alpha-L-rhamnosidase n=1 Tax=Leifsonia kafniensis TaxID=475957 RepID=A0ABP7KLZ9_9MICO
MSELSVARVKRTPPSPLRNVVVGMMAIALAAVMVVPVAPASAAEPSTLSVVGLETNDLVNPLGIDGTNAPILSWQSVGTGRGVVQTAYQVRAAATESALAGATLWDSGKVVSDQQLNITYAGPDVTSQTSYAWQVKVWDNKGNESDWSAPASFETAFLSNSEWKADWVGGVDPSAEMNKWTDYRVDVDFTLKKAAFGVFLRSSSSGADSYMWQLNDEKAGQPRLRPHKRVGGNWVSMPEVDLTTKGLAADVLKHRGTLSVTVQGGQFVTTVNGVVVDTRTESTHSKGYVGIRTDISTAEEVTVHSMKVSSVPGTGASGDLYTSNFTAGDNPFKRGDIVAGPEGGLHIAGQTEAIWSPKTALPLLRKSFATDSGKTIAQARVHASARGLYELSINGEKVGDEELAPGWTDFTQRFQYQTYDVTKQLQNGDNVIGAWVGTGWYSGYVAWYGDKKYGKNNSVTAELVIDFTDGTQQVIRTDPSWKTSTGPLVSSDLLMGEEYDATLEQAGWDSPGFNADAWSSVTVADNKSTAMLHPQTDEPVRVTQVMPTQTRTEAPAGSGNYVYDLGQNLSGVAEVTLTGTAGDRVRIRHAEVLNTDGSLYLDNLRSAKATDTYRFAADGTITYRPKFTQHGFRYIEISGVKTVPELADVRALVFGSDMAMTGEFTTSDPMLNQLQSNIAWGQRGNFISVPTDTPARDERLGYTGDLNAFAGTAAFNMDSLAFIKKWLKDVRDTQLPDGEYPESAPRGPDMGCCNGGTGWSDGGITIPWMSWKRYGDTDIIAQNYASMEKYFGYLSTNFPDYIRDDGPYGDWLDLNDPTPAVVLGTAYYAYDARVMSEMATAIGKTADAAKYTALETAVTDAFVTNFVAADGGVTGNSQTAYALALGMDLVPDNLREAAGKKLVAKLASRDYHLSTGFVGTPWLMPALSETGNWDVAYRLLLNKTLPSWGYEVESGATTMWERWDSIDANGNYGPASMNSFNHYAFGAVGDWMYQNIGGITVDDIGYKSITIAPRPGGGLTHAAASFDSVYGTVSTDWAQTGDDFSLATVVPTNATATVHIPAASVWAVTESGNGLADAEGVTVVSSNGTDVVVTVGSGSYDFSVNAQADTLGSAIDSAAALADKVDGLKADDMLTTGQAAQLNSHLQDVIDASVAAIPLLATDHAAVVEHVRAALAAVRAASSWLTGSGVAEATATSLATDLDTLDRQLSAIVTTLAGLTVHLDAGDTASYLPGQTVTLTGTLENTGTEPLTGVISRVEAENAWSVVPASAPTIAALGVGEKSTSTFTLTVPEDQLPGTVALPLEVSYAYLGTAVTTSASASIVIGSGVTISTTATPSTVMPATKTIVTVTIANAGTLPVSGRASVSVPTGWVTPVPTTLTVVAPGKTAAIPVEIFVPTTLSEETVNLTATFDRGGTELASAGVALQATVARPAGSSTVYDHIDLGDGASEGSHNVRASAGSGTSSEAGLSRRYSGSAANSSFEFDMAVPKSVPFVIRAVETFDGPRLKEYAVSVNGVVVQNRLFQRVPNSGGASNYQILVDDPAAFSTTGTVHVMFKHAASNYDPSIADAWTLPAPSDTLAPSVSATTDPSVPNTATGWFTQSPVGVTLQAQDDRVGDLAIEYALGSGAMTGYSSAISLADEGEHALTYQATDVAGNASVIQSLRVKIDTVAPATTATRGAEFDGESARTSGTIRFGATDATSGVAETRYRVNGGEWKAGDAVTVTTEGAFTVDYASTDVAGNVEKEQSITGTIIIVPKSTVRFDSQGGSTVAAVSVDNGTVIKAPKAPTRTGYTFAGWYTKATGGSAWNFTNTVKADVTLYAHWTVQKRTVTFSSQGGSTVAAVSTNYNTAIKAPKSPTRTGYTFKGWYTKATGGTKWNFTAKVTSNATAYAHWTVQKRTVTFNAQGGSKVAAVSTNYNTVIKAPKSPTRTGYTFAGWFTKATGGSKWNFTAKVTSSATAYAHWTVQKRTVTFNAQGGSKVAAVSTNYNTVIKAPKAPTRSGYVFTGWYTKATGGSKWKFTAKVTANATAYAHWAKK